MVKAVITLGVVIIALFAYLKHQNSTINELENDIRQLNYERDNAVYLHERKKLDSIVYKFKTDTIYVEKIITKYEKKSDSIISLGDSAVHGFISSYLNAYTSR